MQPYSRLRGERMHFVKRVTIGFTLYRLLATDFVSMTLGKTGKPKCS